MKINQKGIDLIISFEGCRLEAYPDPGTGDEPWTIGVGHTGPEVHKGLKIDQAAADNLLRKDLEKFEQGVSKLLEVKVNDNEFAALVCFAFNVGLTNLKQSTLLRCLNKLNRSDAANEFLKWNHANGKILEGLTRRRKAERELFLS